MSKNEVKYFPKCQKFQIDVQLYNEELSNVAVLKGSGRGVLIH